MDVQVIQVPLLSEVLLFTERFHSQYIVYSSSILISATSWDTSRRSLGFGESGYPSSLLTILSMSSTKDKPRKKLWSSRVSRKPVNRLDYVQSDTYGLYGCKESFPDVDIILKFFLILINPIIPEDN